MHSEYITIFALTRQKWLRERAPLLRYTYTACLVQCKKRRSYHSLTLALCVKVKVKVKVTLVQALMLCTGRTAHRGSRGIALLFHDHGTRRGWGVSVTPCALFNPGRDPVLIVQEAGCAPWPVGTGAENLVPTGIRSPDRPARSKSLYRLRYPLCVKDKNEM